MLKALGISFSFFKHFLFSRRGGALIKVISWLCVLGIGTGMFALVVVMSVMNGFNTSIRERNLSVEPHLVIYLDRGTEAAAAQAIEWMTQNKITHDQVDTQDVILRTESGFVHGAVAQGVSQKTLNTIIASNRKRQSRPVGEASEYKLLPQQVVVGMGLGDAMGLFEMDTLVVIAPESLLGPKESLPVYETVRVKDFLRTDLENIDAQKFYYVRGNSLARLQNTASLEKTIEVRLKDPENFNGTKSKLEKMGLRVDSWKDRNSNLFYSLKLEKFVVGLLLGLSSVIASFSLVTLMVIMVTQKRKDIGVLMAMGYEAKTVTSIFQFMGIIVALVGIIGGIVLGVPVCYLLANHSQGLLPSIYSETNIPAEMHFVQISFLFLMAFIFSVAISWLAVRRITKMTPVDALKGI